MTQLLNICVILLYMSCLGCIYLIRLLYVEVISDNEFIFLKLKQTVFKIHFFLSKNI